MEPHDGCVFSSVATPEADDMDPFQAVILQEGQRINYLLETMTDSLELTFRGDVPLTDAMEKLHLSCVYRTTGWLQPVLRVDHLRRGSPVAATNFTTPAVDRISTGSAAGPLASWALKNP
ncbi:unnamed protein product [Phytophthora lilii]|uniref:Unnamed protein product n=1 Tax=Phytophthora lilii TaxID=2077276 RepID=A0A9W6X5T2_9STRA|nr:unnamed protein product [Phytophthora lilii]